MDQTTPRIATVAIAGPGALRVKWKNRLADRIDLVGWIATGGDLLAPLRDPEVFSAARVADYGTSIAWGKEDDLRIDAVHLEQIACEQRPFGAAQAIEWQKAMGLSNREVAAILDISPSTWNAYKAGSRIPNVIAMLCRAARRDPIVMQAHYRPRTAGRPRKMA